MHLDHIQVDRNIKLKDVLDKQKDLYEIKQFYDNYTKPDKKRNYKIYSVKYEDIFDKQNELSKILGIGKLNLVRRETKRNNNAKNIKRLNHVYSNLIDTMNKNDFIMIN